MRGDGSDYCLLSSPPPTLGHRHCRSDVPTWNFEPPGRDTKTQGLVEVTLRRQWQWWQIPSRGRAWQCFQTRCGFCDLTGFVTWNQVPLVADYFPCFVFIEVMWTIHCPSHTLTRISLLPLFATKNLDYYRSYILKCLVNYKKYCNFNIRF